MPISLEACDSKQVVEAEKFMKKCLGETIAVEKKLKQLVSCFKKPKTTAKAGTINSQIYKSDTATQGDIISRLPNEIKAAVWSYLDNAGDRLMLALTCKWNAAMFEELKEVKHHTNEIGAARKNPSASAKSKQTARKAVAVHATKGEIIAILQRLQQWTPLQQKYRLCYVCQSFKFKTIEPKVRGFMEKGWGGRQIHPLHYQSTKPLSIPELEIQGHRCPSCVDRKNADIQKLTPAYYDTKRKLQEMGALKR